MGLGRQRHTCHRRRILAHRLGLTGAGRGTVALSPAELNFATVKSRLVSLLLQKPAATTLPCRSIATDAAKSSPLLVPLSACCQSKPPSGLNFTTVKSPPVPVLRVVPAATTLPGPSTATETAMSAELAVPLMLFCQRR